MGLDTRIYQRDLIMERKSASAWVDWESSATESLLWYSKKWQPVSEWQF
jgi:hypothetical protein